MGVDIDLSSHARPSIYPALDRALSDAQPDRPHSVRLPIEPALCSVIKLNPPSHNASSHPLRVPTPSAPPGLPSRRCVSVRPTHLPNSSIKDDGVRVFLSGRDSPYRRDFHAPTKLLPQTVQGPGCSGVPATRCDRFQRCHPPRHQCQRHSQVATALSRSTASGVAGVRSCESYAKTTS